jgi:hypothetical protein
MQPGTSSTTPMDASPFQPIAGFELHALPHDLIHNIIMQAALGARELCRLEQCSRTTRSFIVDDVAWRRVFLASRRSPALATPLCWKAELVRREDWSRSWRQRGLSTASETGLSTANETNSGSSAEGDATMPLLSLRPHDPQPTSVLARCVVPPARKKLRRLAQMMFPGALTGTQLHTDVHIVDPSIPECFSSIRAAIACAKPQDTVLIAPGTYRERLDIDKPIDIIGMGPIGAVTIIAVDGPVVAVTSSRVACRVAKLTIEQQSLSEGAPMSGAVRCEGGAVLVLEDCHVTSAAGHCIVIKGMDSCGYILHNMVSNGKGVGILVCDHARGLIEDNDVVGNSRAGVAILSGANPVVRLNRIHAGKDAGVLVSEKGRGRIEENDIFANLRAGVAILREGSPFVSRNRIFDGFDSGVLVCEQGKGSVVDNDIYANQMAGVAIGHGGASTVKGNTIRDGSGGSLLCLSTHSRGLICANVIDQDPGAILHVPDGLLPEVQELNLIRFIGQVHLSC